MNVLLGPALAGLLVLLNVLVALAAYSLRDFSRSRLFDLCRKRGREERFGVILRRHEDVLLAVELLWVLTISALAVQSIVWLGLWNVPSADPAGWVAYLLKTAFLVFVLALVGVVVPWAVARVSGERFLASFWPVLNGLRRVLRPLLLAMRKIDKFAHRLSGLKEPREGDASVLTDEIRTVVDEGQREGVLESEARTMIHRVIELQKEDVAAIMTPRTEMNCLRVDSTLEQARGRLLEAGHSRMPVIGETTDEIVGIVYAKDLLKHIDVSNGKNVALVDILRKPLYVPETTGIDTLLQTMKRERVHLAIVIDEYSGVAGLVTMEDILEEIVGEIVDEYDAAEEQGIRAVAPGVTEVDARVHIDDLNEQFDFDLPEDGDYDTIGGFVFAHLGRVPKSPESFTWRNLKITVHEGNERKLHKLRIEVDKTTAEITNEGEPPA